jgi:hypothetical protein
MEYDFTLLPSPTILHVLRGYEELGKLNSGGRQNRVAKFSEEFDS